MKFLLLCTMALILSAGSCKKNAENQLPPATQTGANTFGCLINGKIFKVKGVYTPGILYTSPGVGFYGKYDARKTIFAKDRESGASFDFYAFERKLGRYDIISDIAEVTSGSYVEVTKYDDNVISGKFQYEYKYKDGTKISVTKGRFDIKL